MSDPLPDVPALRVIDPPPHGLTRLGLAIERDDHQRASRRRWWLVTAPVVVVLALVLFLRREPEREVAKPSSEVAPVADPEISPTFYWVASTPRSHPVAPARRGPTQVKPVEIVEPSELQPSTHELR